MCVCVHMCEQVLIFRGGEGLKTVADPMCNCTGSTGEYGRRHPPLFFLKSSFWSGQNPANRTALDNETDYEFSDDSFEPVSMEFHGKEAIR